jgi:hypothetical protein
MALLAPQSGPPALGTMSTSPPSISSSSNARTPDEDSDDSDFEMADRGESYKLQPRAERAAANDEEDEEEEDEKYTRRRGASMSTVHSFQLYTPDEERAVVRKFDRKLVLFVALLYMLSFLDRSSLSPFPGRDLR